MIDSSESGARSLLSRRALLAARLEPLIELLIRVCGFSAIFFVFGILLFVFAEGAEFIFKRLDIGQFLTSSEWYPTSVANKRYGTLALIAGTASVTLLAMVIAVPLGIGTAIFISEFTRGRTATGWNSRWLWSGLNRKVTEARPGCPSGDIFRSSHRRQQIERDMDGRLS